MISLLLIFARIQNFLDLSLIVPSRGSSFSDLCVLLLLEVVQADRQDRLPLGMYPDLQLCLVLAIGILQKPWRLSTWTRRAVTAVALPTVAQE